MRSTRCSSPARPATPPEPRLAAHLLIAALRRRIAAEGGTATILHRGEAEAGAILVVGQARGVPTGTWERSLAAAGYALHHTGPDDPAALPAYLDRRLRADPDLWVIELDADGDLPERIARAVLE